MKVLVVEDNAVTGSSLTELLRQAGYETEWAANVAAARSHLTVSKPGAIVLDYLLDGETAVGLLQELALNPDLCLVPVVLITGVGGQDYASVARIPVAVLRKPFQSEELVAILQGIEGGK